MAKATETPEIGTSEVNAGQLRALIERIERLEEETESAVRRHQGCLWGSQSQWAGCQDHAEDRVDPQTGPRQAHGGGNDPRSLPRRSRNELTNQPMRRRLGWMRAKAAGRGPFHNEASRMFGQRFIAPLQLCRVAYRHSYDNELRGLWRAAPAAHRRASADADNHLDLGVLDHDPQRAPFWEGFHHQPGYRRPGSAH